MHLFVQLYFSLSFTLNSILPRSIGTRHPHHLLFSSPWCNEKKDKYRCNEWEKRKKCSQHFAIYPLRCLLVLVKWMDSCAFFSILALNVLCSLTVVIAAAAALIFFFFLPLSLPQVNFLKSAAAADRLHTITRRVLYNTQKLNRPGKRGVLLTSENPDFVACLCLGLDRVVPSRERIFPFIGAVCVCK